MKQLFDTRTHTWNEAGLARQLSANRTQGIPGMIAMVRETAQRLAA